MALNPQKVTELVALFKKSYPKWTSFSAPIDPDFQQEEIIYKRALVAKAQDLLSEEILRQICEGSDSPDYENFLSRFEIVGRSANLLWLNIPSTGDLNILHHPALDKSSFCKTLLDLLYGLGTFEERLERYLNYINYHNLPNKWTFLTYFLFLCHPDTEIFTKPSSMRSLIEFAGEGNRLAATPTTESYIAIKQFANQLKDALKDYAPRDMVDIQSFIWTCSRNLPHYWKISLDETAQQWEEFRDRGLIAIDCGLGDLSKLSDKEFHAHCYEIEQQDVAEDELDEVWEFSSDEVWKFSKMKEGDRIVVINDNIDLLGVCTVSGSYYFNASRERYRHCLPVEWDSITCQVINKPSLTSKDLRRIMSGRLVDLDKQTFERLLDSVNGIRSGSIPPVMNNHPDCPFSPTTFELLAKLSANPRKDVYDAHKTEFREQLEQPFQRLLLQVADRLPETITDRMEIRKKLFAKILKNDFGQGKAWDFYWGAFYPKGGKRIEDAQLFLWINQERLEFGFYIGQYGSSQRQKFLQNCQGNSSKLIELLQDSLEDKRLWYGSRANPEYLTLQEWLQNPGTLDIHVAVSLTKQEVLQSSASQLVEQITQTHQQLFPLVLLAISENPIPEILEYLGILDDDEDDLKPPNELYSLFDFSADTQLELELLRTWTHAIERKKQAVLYGPPGTGKTFVAQKLAKHLISEGDGFIDIVQFHPAYTYEDFIQGIRPKRVEGSLDYPIVPGRFLEFCKQARQCRDRCVLIVDEINRANLPQVFGELMYLMEYRDAKIHLASGETFSIPSNVRIIGTMNTADRSIALVDHALRRRFAFLYLPPNYEGLSKFHASTGYAVEKLISQLQQINAQIGDRHYEIGTSFFLRHDLETQLQSIWQLEIEPYLEEFFFDQPDKVKTFRWKAVKSQLVP